MSYGNHNYKRLSELYKLMNAFWDYYKDVPRCDRAALADICIRILQNHGVSQWDLQCLRMRHPSTRIKDKRSRFTVLDILADFIMDVAMKEEKTAEYPVMNQDAEIRRENQRQEKETALLLDEDTRDSDKDWPGERVIGAYEHSFNEGNPVEDALFNKKESGSVTAEEFKRDISELKTKPNGFIKRYADGSRWSELRPEWKRTKRRVRAAIRKLDENRVRTCRVCKNGFFSRNGRHVCDVMRSKDNPSISVCDREYQKNYKKFTETA